MLKPGNMRGHSLGINWRINYIIRFVTIPVVLMLLLYNLRRFLLLFAALLAPKKRYEQKIDGNSSSDVPSILIIVSCRDEETLIPGLCASLAALDYPQTRYQVVLIDDGSRDSTREQMESYARARPGWFVLSIPENVGKASALNMALTRVSFGEIVIIFDADHRPNPDVLERAVTYFDHDRVAGVSGRTLALNPLASPSAYYSTVEGNVHQMVTMRAKDRLGLAPALMGSNCAYRRSALVRCGGFRTGALLEDSDLTLVFYREGYVVRFAEDMVSYHQVPETVDGYIKQHTRWARGFNDVAQSHALSLARDRRLPLPQRFELILFATGYLDRIALAGAIILSLLSSLNRRITQFPNKILFFALLTPLIQIIALFIEQKVGWAMWLRFPLVPLFFLLDLYSAGRAMTDTLLNRARVWTKTERILE